MNLEKITEATVQRTKARRLATVSVILAVSGFLLGSLCIKIFYFIYLCWIIWFVACRCGIKSLKYTEGIKGFLWSRFFAHAGCYISLIFALGGTYILHDISVIDRVHCRSNIFVLGKSIRDYCENHNGKFPEPSKWCDLIIDEGENALVSKETFRCLKVSEGTSGYAMNKSLSGKSISDVDPNTVLLFETNTGWNQNGGHEIMCYSRRGFLFKRSWAYIVCVGKEKPLVRSVHRSDIKKLCWNP